MHTEKVKGRILDIIYTSKNAKSDPNQKHCCDQMSFHIHEKEKIIIFVPEFREYSIRASKSIIQRIDFCPWCGIKLPTDLREEFFDILDKEYNLDTLCLDKRKIPKEFRSDEWWKKRGL